MKALVLALAALLMSCGSSNDSGGPSDSGESRLLAVTPDPLAFQSVTLGRVAETDVTITNLVSARGPLTGSSSISGAGFTILSGGGAFSLAPGESRVLTVRFAPESADLYTGTITITHDATNSASPRSVPLIGPGDFARCFSAALAGSQEVPATSSTATGYGTFILSPDRSALTYDIHHGGLAGTETAAHIHKGEPDVAGVVVFPLAAGSPKQGTLTLTSAEAADLLAGLLYVNIHSSTYPNGEIRGQIIPANGCLGAALAGTNEVPAVNSPALGSGGFALSSDLSVLVYDISSSGLSDTEIAAHLHVGSPGVIGSVVFPLPAGNPKRGTLTLTPTDLANLVAGQLYVNIHTITYAGGEIRGQIVAPGACFTAALSGAQQTPPVAGGGSGSGTFLLSSTGASLSYDVRFTGLSGAEIAAHIHQGPHGVTGSVLFPLPSGSPKQGNLTLTEADAAALIAGQLYVNIHTNTYANGEIRGQIVPAACSVQ